MEVEHLQQTSAVQLQLKTIFIIYVKCFMGQFIHKGKA